MWHEAERKTGSRIFRAVKLITIVGVIFALGKFALSFFGGEDEALEDPSGV